MSLEADLREVLNRNSAENGSNTPDRILAKYLVACLDAFNEGVKARQEWWGYRLPWPFGPRDPKEKWDEPQPPTEPIEEK